jgi:hypothetical protein
VCGCRRRIAQRLEEHRQIARSLRPLRGLFLETPLDHPHERWRQARHGSAERGGLLTQHRGLHFRHGLPRKGMRAGQHLVHHDAEREQIGLRGGGMPEQLLRCHVAESPEYLPGFRQ